MGFVVKISSIVGINIYVRYTGIALHRRRHGKQNIHAYTREGKKAHG